MLENSSGGRTGRRRRGRKIEGMPIGVVEDGDVRPLSSQAASLAYGHLAGSDGLGAADHLVPRGLAGGSDASLHFPHEQAMPWCTKSRPSLKLRIPTRGIATLPFLERLKE